MAGSLWNKLIWISMSQIPLITLLRGRGTFSRMWYAGMSSSQMSDVLDANHQPHNEPRQNQSSFGVSWNIHRFWALELIFCTIQINSEEIADKEASNFTASVASTYGLQLSKITLSVLSNDLHGPELFCEFKKTVTWNPVYSVKNGS
jgi:hypothetical protein